MRRFLKKSTCLPIVTEMLFNQRFPKGLIVQGILMEVLAKLLGTLLVARVFALTKPQLLTFAFLLTVYTTITRWLNWAHLKVTETSVYRWMKQLRA